MKFLAVVAATMLTASSLVPATAEAAPKRHHGWKWTTKTVCKTRWHHARKVRHCKKVRVRVRW